MLGRSLTEGHALGGAVPAAFPWTSRFYRDISASWALLTAGSIGFVYAILLLHKSAISGDTPFWHHPSGLIGNALDIRNTLSGYWWFVLDRWRWPLLAVSAPNWPQGANAERFDIVPVVALLGKIYHALMGQAVNPYPWWATGCFTLNAAALCSLVRGLGQRGLLAAVTAGAFGAMAPVVQARFGHLALMAHWLPIFMLSWYFHRARRRAEWIGILALCALAASVHLYLFVMTAAIATAVFLQAAIDKRCSTRMGAAAIAGILASGAITLWMLGMLQEQDLAGISGDYRRYSMNLLSPFWPQTSGLFAWTGSYWLNRGMIGATPGQYEGFSYLGFGGVLLVVVAAVIHLRTFFHALRNHYALIAILAVLLAWSLSDRVYLGDRLLLSFEMPGFLANSVLGWFRSCGRFFWPLAWLILACGIAGVSARAKRGSAQSFLLAMLVIQWIDVAPWRERFARLIGEPETSIFGSPENAGIVETFVRQIGSVVLVPPIGCSSAAWDYASPLNAAAMEIQMMTARANARMGHPYLSRARQSCDEPDGLVGPHVLILLHDPARDMIPVDTSRCDIYGKTTVCLLGSP
jgi:Family of unknown function (DUF6311)